MPRLDVRIKVVSHFNTALMSVTVKNGIFPDNMNSPLLLTRSGIHSRIRFSWSSLPTQFSQITQSSFRLPRSCFVLSSFIGVFLSLVFSRFPGQRKPCHSWPSFLIFLLNLCKSKAEYIPAAVTRIKKIRAVTVKPFIRVLLFFGVFPCACRQ